MVDVPAREVVVHTEAGPGYAVRRPSWTAEQSVRGVPVDLAALLTR